MLDSPAILINLLDGPSVTVGGRLSPVPEGAQRLVVLFALRRHASRAAAAALLWPEVDERRAAGNLRSALWRLRRAGLMIITEREGVLSMIAGSQTDVDLLCQRLAEQAARPIDGSDLTATAAALNLLPGWYEEWLEPERDRIRERVLSALIMVAVRLGRSGRCADAIDTALVAVAADPLRDGAQAALIAAHLAEGNVGEAHRAYAVHRNAMRRELGRGPSERLRQLAAEASGSAA